ncbi:GNAT family N-acetyltransferase [Aurantiacibacter rhizosphaerae]|uniref:GNAT family N-acetyltransferase n=1 Tax=Aurantiacibacter rhizosphaerae TaxID=2691582 RepID=A0A844XFR6_9SPHN|nr:GNAT family protein [Aurantiacibacter rhizosphaerae]MWV28434.1 GNAT family N-acetyltransferase [Aurantiacibacter rhizosphaerae]
MSDSTPPLTTPPITTARFQCRPLKEGDEIAFWPAFSSDVQMRYWGRGPFDDPEEFREYLFDTRGTWNGRTWICEPRGGGDPVFRMVASSDVDEVAEIGYIMVPGNGGRGIARECVGGLISHLFHEEGFHRLYADVDPRNTRSNALLKRLGFTREGHLRHTMKTHIGWTDTWLWGLLSDEWPGKNAAKPV